MGIHLMHRFGGRGRRYPIKRAASGRSARRRAFDLFEQGMRPSRVAPLVNIHHTTAYRYFQQWKKPPRHLEITYNVVRAALHGGGIPAEQFVQALAAMLQIPPEHVLKELERPWGLKRLMAGRPRHPDRAEIRRQTLTRLDAALKLVYLYEAKGIAPERIVEELDRLRDKIEASGRRVAPRDSDKARSGAFPGRRRTGPEPTGSSHSGL